MTKATCLLINTTLLILLLISETITFADAIETEAPTQAHYGFGFLSMLIILVIIVLLGLIAWLIIRSITKKSKSN